MKLKLLTTYTVYSDLLQKKLYVWLVSTVYMSMVWPHCGINSVKTLLKIELRTHTPAETLWWCAKMKKWGQQAASLVTPGGKNTPCCKRTRCSFSGRPAWAAAARPASMGCIEGAAAADKPTKVMLPFMKRRLRTSVGLCACKEINWTGCRYQ